VLAISLLALTFSTGERSAEKLSAYECGFNPFESSRQKFEVKFYLVALLFILFDVEIALLFPLVFVFSIINTFGFFVAVLFIVLLIVGFLYELQVGALNWY
jgi:NADH:ubiquinone oxidoreductase subunit 3 (subunit A)